MQKWKCILLLAFLRRSDCQSCLNCASSNLANIYDPNSDPNLSQKQFQLPLLIPPVWTVDPANGCLGVGIRQISTQVVSGLPKTSQFGYGQSSESMSTSNTYSSPGPTLQVAKGSCVCVNWVNQLYFSDGKCRPHLLDIVQTYPWANPPGGTAGRDKAGNGTGAYSGPIPTVTNVVGQLGNQDSIGYPQAWYLPDCSVPSGYATTGSLYEEFRNTGLSGWGAGVSVYQYCNNQAAESLLYKDATFGMARYNVQVGLYGRYTITGSSSVGLSNTKQVELTLQDATFNLEGQYVLPFDPYGCSTDNLLNDTASCPVDFFGNVLLVNGRAWPQMQVNERCYQFSIINTASSRFFNISFDNVAEFTLLSTGSEFLNPSNFPNGLPVSSLLIAPGGHAEILVDFHQLLGNTVTMLNSAPDGPLCSGGSSPPSVSTSSVMAFNVVAPTQSTTTYPSCPKVTLPSVSHLSTSTVASSVAYVSQANHSCPTGQASRVLSLNAYFQNAGTPTARHFNDPITEFCTPGQVPVWSVYNYAATYDTLHLDGARTEVTGAQDLYGNAIAYPSEQLGIKPVIMLLPQSVTLVRVQCPSAGLFTWGTTLGERKDYDEKAPFCAGTVASNPSCQVANKELFVIPREQLCMIQTSFQSGIQCLEKDPLSSNVILDYCYGSTNQLWLKPSDLSKPFVLKNEALVNNQSACITVLSSPGGTGELTAQVWTCDSSNNYELFQFQNTAFTGGLIVSAAPFSAPKCLDWITAQGTSGQFSQIIANSCPLVTTQWTFTCGPSCAYSDWQSWSSCTANCGGGKQTRVRTASYSGLQWCTDTTQSASCNTFNCAVQQQCMVLPTYDPYHQKCLTVTASNTLAVQACTGQNSQLWTYTGQVLQSMKVVNGLVVCMTVATDLSVTAWPCPNGVGTSNQQWSEYFNALVSVPQGLCLEITGGIDWTLELQGVDINTCTGVDNQAWQFLCTAADACVNACPGQCLCQLDTNLNPFCNCPGSSCSNLMCFNGGQAYYSGSDCLCNCPVGFSGIQCQTAITCSYTSWSAWSLCSSPCAGGSTTSTRQALSLPGLCTATSTIGVCNPQPCTGGQVAVPSSVSQSSTTGQTSQSSPGAIVYAPMPQPLQATGTLSCQLQWTVGNTMSCAQALNGQLSLAACATNNPNQLWSFDGTYFRTSGLCLDIAGSVTGTTMDVWSCHNGQNQQFALNGGQLTTLNSNCVQQSGSTTALVSGSCATSAGTWAMSCTNSTAAQSTGTATSTGTNTGSVTVVSGGSSGGSVTAGGSGCSLVVGGSGNCLSTDGYNVVMAACNGSLGQQWVFGQTDQTLRSSAFPNNCINIDGGMRGVNIISWACVYSPNELFTYTGTTITASDGRCLDVSGGAWNTNVDVWACNGGQNQQWTLTCGSSSSSTTGSTSSSSSSSSCGAWGSWSACSVSCGYGIQARTAATVSGCAKPVSTQVCNAGACLPADCSYGAWSSWSSCSASCGGGFSTSYRTSTGGAVSAAGPCTNNAAIQLCGLTAC